MKKILILGLLAWGCSPKVSEMTTMDWSRDSGQKPPAYINKIQGDHGTQVESRSGIVEIQNQSLEGLTVANSFVKKIKDKKGELVRFQAHVENQDPSRLNLLQWKRAEKNKQKTLNEILAYNPRLQKMKVERFDMILAEEDGTLVPRWSLDYTEPNGEIWQIIFSYDLQPKTLERLGSQFDITPAWVYPKGPKQGNLQEVALRDLKPANELISTLLKVSSATEVKVPVNGQPLQFQTNDQRFDQVQAFYMSQRTIDWFVKNFGIKVAQTLDLQVHVGSPDKTNTAFYYAGRVRLGAGDDLVYSKIPWDPTIVAHETSHYVIDLMSRLPFQGEGGSLNEGFADYFSAVINGNPNMAESSYLPEPFKRKIDAPVKFTAKKGALYGDSLIVSSLLWDANKILGESKGIQLAFSVLQNLTPASDFEGFRAELLKQSGQILSAGEQQKLIQLLREREWKTDI